GRSIRDSRSAWSTDTGNPTLAEPDWLELLTHAPNFRASTTGNRVRRSVKSRPHGSRESQSITLSYGLLCIVTRPQVQPCCVICDRVWQSNCSDRRVQEPLGKPQRLFLITASGRSFSLFIAIRRPYCEYVNR